MLFAACAADWEENPLVYIRSQEEGNPCRMVLLPSASQKVREILSVRNLFNVDFVDVNIRGNPAFVALNSTAVAHLCDSGPLDGTGQFILVLDGYFPDSAATDMFVHTSRPVEIRTHGWTPLHTACAAGNLEVVKVLLEYGADVTTVDNSDKPHTPMDVAIAMNHFDIVMLLHSNKECRDRLVLFGNYIWYGGVIAAPIFVVYFVSVFIAWIPLFFSSPLKGGTLKTITLEEEVIASNSLGGKGTPTWMRGTLMNVFLLVCTVVTGIIVRQLWISDMKEREAEADTRRNEAIEQLLKEEAAEARKKNKAKKKIKARKQPHMPHQLLADEQPPVAMMEPTKEADTALQAALEASLRFLVAEMKAHASHATPAVLTAAIEARQQRVDQALKEAIAQEDLAGIVSVLTEYAQYGSQEVVDKARKARDEIKKKKKNEEKAAREAAEKMKRQARIDALLKEVPLGQAEAALKAARGIDEAPNEFLCPVTQELMEDPVIATDGHTYERSEIERWFKQSLKSPKTLETLPSAALIPNHQLRSLIVDWKEKNGK
jgi:hypothetical protein